MDIRKYIVYSQLLCLLLASKVNWAQNDLFIENHSEKQYLLQGLKISDDGKWIAVGKMYETNNDTILIFRNELDFPSFIKSEVQQVEFLACDKMLFLKKDTVELLDYFKGVSKHYPNIKKISTLKSSNQFILHYNDKYFNSFQLLNNNGKCQFEIKNTINYSITASESIYVTTLNRDIYEIFKIKDNSILKIFTTANRITNIYVDNSEKGIVILSEDFENSSRTKVEYLDLLSKKITASNSIKNDNVISIHIKCLKDSEFYGIEVWRKKKRETPIVEVWNSTDNSLENSHFNDSFDTYYLWNLIEDEIKLLGNQLVNKISFLGNNFILSFDPYKNQNYTKAKNDLDLFMYDIIADEYNYIDRINSEVYSSNNGYFILYLKNENWIFYDLISRTKEEIISPNKLSKPTFSKDDQYILFNGLNGVWKYDIQNKQLILDIELLGFDVKLINNSFETLAPGYDFYRRLIDLNLPIFIELTSIENLTKSLALVHEEQYRIITNPTKNYISQISYDSRINNIIYTIENFNMPPEIHLNNGTDEKIIYKSNINDKSILGSTQEIIKYKNKEGDMLSGILYYPLNYDQSKIFPMVVHLYEKQNSLNNHYLPFRYSEGIGFNIRSLIEKGYFVYLPDIVVGEQGPGLSALDCVTEAINAIQTKLIDKRNIALIGHSFGGYLTNFIATQSNLFKTFISGSGNSDLVHSYHSYNYEFLNPEYKRIESSIYHMIYPFSQKKELYFKNNPIYFAEYVQSPILLWTGKLDENVPMDETMSFFLALKRNNKKVTALFYPNEHHSLKSPKAQKNLMANMLDWLDAHLKDSTNNSVLEKSQ